MGAFELEHLKQFTLTRVLNDDTVFKSISLLGKLPSSDPDSEPVQSIVNLQKTAFDPNNASSIIPAISKIQLTEVNDIYAWMLGWIRSADGTYLDADVKISVISPATDVHIRKYSSQKHAMISETPKLYEKVTKPFIDAFPKSRTQWVQNILDHITETEDILFEDPSPIHGFVLLPDMKWDRKSLGSLYLLAIARSALIRSLRDLRKEHVPMLERIRQEATRVASEKWGVPKGGLRFYIHYQPSYYQFHVHIVSVEYSGFQGMSVGQAHLLEDVISLLELDDGGPTGIFERMTLTYILGEQHGLYTPMVDAGAEI
ncbi:scavenger mRNA decapping enzyme [Cantharellus anzutake]|uniref:scavenger mRNA decapping enzyme n=1 Tax=Cantharellus anzutake TaxID=1750568 RepID=UPI001908589F|nr:scavenger mRNA decapping enzyme [Cantharellus anzutake]KAF8321067.1 scavenger mRNA decapping enzyme [Cantharellus anzutake]